MLKQIMSHKISLYRSRKGFTLIELVAVMAIVGVLAVALLPSIEAAMNRSENTRIITTLTKIDGAIKVYQLEHASTQMTITNSEGVKFAAEMGMVRSVLARECTLEDIKTICAKSDSEIEVFIHGALCVCYSGQCLMSSLIGGRSGNRGRCAQPCRLPYTLVNKEGKNILEHGTSGAFSGRNSYAIRMLGPRTLGNDGF